ncbi:hypothetical protein P5673_027477 [Acropora cervicornis]|uniref:Uncharacterized protein n=1 Tax=Acropora cervicornis TaxID=6130 RepID=A0AAD9PZ22_ACRCE|nr:hypothetical protein P5673_027477 [Acropora cervicornis]
MNQGEKKLPQEKKLSLSRAMDIGRSGKTTNIRLKELKNKTRIPGTDDEIDLVTPSRTENDRTRRDKGIIRSCRYCGGRHRRGDSPVCCQSCKKCARRNHFSQVCQQRNTSQKFTSANVVTQSHRPNLSDNDSGDSIMTLVLSHSQRKLLSQRVGKVVEATD